MLIRKAKLKDVHDILLLWKEFMKEHKRTIKQPEKKECLKFNSNAIERFTKFIKWNIKSPNAVIFVSEDSSKITGFVIAHIKNNIPIFKIKKLCYITDLFVKKESRGEKISSSLMDKLLEWSKSKSVKNISLGVLPENILARKIYKKWNFFEYHLEMRKNL